MGSYTQTRDQQQHAESFTSETSQPLQQSSHHVATRGFAQMFGLHPAMALLTLMVDAMLFGGEAVSLGTSIPVSLFASVVIGVIVFMAQRKWYGDDDESAGIKALIIAFLTAIPTPLPAMFYIPAGIVGLFRKK